MKSSREGEKEREGRSNEGLEYKNTSPREGKREAYSESLVAAMDKSWRERREKKQYW